MSSVATQPGSSYISAVAVSENIVNMLAFNKNTSESTVTFYDRKTNALINSIDINNPFGTSWTYAEGLAVNGADMYVSVASTHQILKYSGGTWTLFAGSMLGYSGYVNGPRGTSSRFSSPGACCILGNTLYVADAGGTLLRAVSLLNGATSLAAGRPGLPGAAVDGPRGQLLRVTSMCADIYPNRVVLTDGNAIRLIHLAPSSYAIQTLAGYADQPGYVNSAAVWPNIWNTAARFNQPRGIAVINEGYSTSLNNPNSPALNWAVYIADTNNHCIRKLTPFNIITLAGSPALSGFNDGSTPLADVRFTFPTAMAADKYGRFVFVADNAEPFLNPASTVTSPTLRKLTINLCGRTCTFEGNAPVFDASETYCGGCPGSDGETCAPTQECVTGVCTCPKPLVTCNGKCVDTTADASNCSACGKECKGDQVCKNGACVDPPCEPPCKVENNPQCTGWTACDHRCVNTNTDGTHCGGCGKPCDAGQACVWGECACAAGYASCAGVCTNTQYDEQNCGGCGIACPADKMCYNGACVCDIYRGFRDCVGDGTCKNVINDSSYCGLCSISCPAGKVCQNRTCVTPPVVTAR